MKVRVIKEGGFYNVQVKRWFWPFWTNKDLGASPCK